MPGDNNGQGAGGPVQQVQTQPVQQVQVQEQRPDYLNKDFAQFVRDNLQREDRYSMERGDNLSFNNAYNGLTDVRLSATLKKTHSKTIKRYSERSEKMRGDLYTEKKNTVKHKEPKDCSENEIKRALNDLKNFDIATLKMGDDKEFAENYVARKKILDEQLVNGERAYYHFLSKSSLSMVERDVLYPLLTKYEALKDIKDYMEVRSSFIMSPYYKYMKRYVEKCSKEELVRILNNSVNKEFDNYKEDRQNVNANEETRAERIKRKGRTEELLQFLSLGLALKNHSVHEKSKFVTLQKTISELKAPVWEDERATQNAELQKARRSKIDAEKAEAKKREIGAGKDAIDLDKLKKKNVYSFLKHDDNEVLGILTGELKVDLTKFGEDLYLADKNMDAALKEQINQRIADIQKRKQEEKEREAAKRAEIERATGVHVAYTEQEKMAELNKARLEMIEKGIAGIDVEKWTLGKYLGVKVGESTLKDSIVRLLSDFLLSDNRTKLDAADNAIMTRLLLLFNSRVEAHEAYIENYVDNGAFYECTHGNKAFATKLKNFIMELMGEDLLLPVNVDLEYRIQTKCACREFGLFAVNDKLENKYKEFAKEFPMYAKNREVMKSDFIQKLFELDGDKFIEKIAQLKAKAEFHDLAIEEMLDDTNLTANNKRKVLGKIKEALGVRYLGSNLSDVRLLTDSFLKNPSSLYLLDNDELKAYRRLDRKEPDEIQNSYKNLVLNELLFGRDGAQDIFDNYSDDEKMDMFLECIRNNAAIKEKFPNLSAENVEALELLGYEEISELTDIVYDGISKYKSALDSWKDHEGKLKMQCVARGLMSGLSFGVAAYRATAMAEKMEKESEKQRVHHDNLFHGSLLGTTDADRTIDYNYENIAGESIWFEKMWGIRVREADNATIERIKKQQVAHNIWELAKSAHLDTTNEDDWQVIGGGEDSLFDVIKAIALADNEVKCLLNGKAKADVVLNKDSLHDILDNYATRYGTDIDELKNRIAIFFTNAKKEADKSGLDISGEFMLFDSGFDMFSTKGMFAGSLLDSNNDNYEKALSKASELLANRIKEVRSKAENGSIDPESEIKLSRFISGMKETDLPTKTERLAAEKYNLEHFGVKNFDEAVTKWHSIFTNNDLKDASDEKLDRLQQNMERLLEYNNGEFALIAKSLLRSPKIIANLNGSDEEVRKFIEKLSYGFKPFLKAGKSHFAFIMEQFISNNYDMIEEACLRDVPATVDEWAPALNKYEDMVMKTKIASQSSLNERLDEIFQYSENVMKGGIDAIITAAQNDPKFFELLVADKKGLKKYVKDYLTNIKENSADVLVKGFKVKYKYDDIQGNNARLKKLQEIGKTIRDSEASIAHNRLVESTVDDMKKKGIEKDKDFDTIRKLNLKIAERPSVYLDEKTGKGYTTDVARTCMAKVEASLKKLKLENRVPATLKSFLAEYVYENKFVDLNNEILWLMGVYMNLKDQIKHVENAGKKIKDEDLVFDASRAAIWTFIHTKSHDIPSDAKRHRFYDNSDPARLLKDGKVDIDPSVLYTAIQDEIGKLGNTTLAELEGKTDAEKEEIIKRNRNKYKALKKELANRLVGMKYADDFVIVSEEDKKELKSVKGTAEEERTVRELRRITGDNTIEFKRIQYNAEGSFGLELMHKVHKQQVTQDPNGFEVVSDTIVDELFDINSIDVEKLDDIAKRRLKLFKKAMKEQKANKEKEEKAAKKAAKKFVEDVKFEEKNPEKLIPKMDVARDVEYQQFKEVEDLNKKIQTIPAFLTHPLMIAEYNDFTKAANLAAFTMSRDEFVRFVNDRQRYFEYTSNVIKALKDKIDPVEDNKYYLSQLPGQDMEPMTLEQANANKEMQLKGFLPIIRERILADLEKADGNLPAVDQAYIDEIYNTFTESNEYYKQLLAQRVSSADDHLDEKFYYGQKGLEDFNGIIANSNDKSLIKKYKSLSSDEKLLFAAALSIGSPSDFDVNAGTMSIIDKVNGEKRKEAVESAYKAYISGENKKFSVDFEAALAVLYDKQASKYNPLEKKVRDLIGQKDRIVLNSAAFDAAYTIVEAARGQKQQQDTCNLTILGDARVSLKQAGNLGYHKSNLLALNDNKPHDLFSFRNALTTIANSDKTAFGTEDSVKGIFGRTNRKNLFDRLLKLEDSELQLLVTVLQDRTILDYKTKAVATGDTVERVNGKKRDIIKSQYLATNNTKLDLMRDSKSEAKVTTALTTLLSFQLRDDVEITGGSVSEFERSSFERKTLIDWRLLEEAFIFMDELKLDESRLMAVKRSSDWILQSGNVKAIDEYEKLKAQTSSDKGFGDTSFDRMLNENAVTDDEKDLVFGFQSLSEEDKALFIRALEHRDILDISCKNKYKSLILGMEQNYVNADGRYALLDEYVKYSRNGSKLNVGPNNHYLAMQSLLSTQVADDLSKKELENCYALEKFASSRDTAIDWELFRNALQFVNRAKLEKNSYYEDKEMLRSLGDYEKIGSFQFNYGLIRKNLNSEYSRTSRFLASRARKKMMDIVPTGNMKKLLGLVLSTNQMNEVNKSGFLLNGTGTASASARNEVLVAKLDKKIEAHNTASADTNARMEAIKKEISAIKDAANDNEDEKLTPAQAGKIKDLEAEYIKLKALKAKHDATAKAESEERLNLVKTSETMLRKEKDEIFDTVQDEKATDKQKAAAKAKYKALTGEEFVKPEELSVNVVKKESELAKVALNGANPTKDEEEKKKNPYVSTYKMDTLLNGTSVQSMAIAERLSQLADAQGISVSFEKLEGENLVTAVWTTTTKEKMSEERYQFINDSFAKAIKEAEKAAVDTKTGLTERELVAVFCKNHGLQNYYENATVMTDLFENMKVLDGHPELEKYEKQISAINQSIEKIVILANSERSTRYKMQGFDATSIVTLAETINTDTANNETAKDILKGAKTATEFYNTSIKAFNELKDAYDAFTTDMSTDRKLLSLMSEQSLGDVIKVFSKYDESGKVQLIADTMSGMKTIGGKVDKLMQMMTGRKSSGNKEGMLDGSDNIVEQLGISDLCDVVAKYAAHFEKDGRAKELIEKTKGIAVMAGNIMKNIVNKPKTLDKDQKAINDFKPDDSLTDEKNEKALKTLKDQLHNDSFSTTGDIVKAVDLKATGEMLAAFMSDKKNIEETKKYTNMINLLKDQVADLYVQFNSTQELHKDIAALNLKNFKDAIDTLDKKGSKEGWLYAAGNAIYTTATLSQNVCKVMLKRDKNRFKDEDGNDTGSSFTKVVNTDGMVEDRLISDMFKESGVDDIIDMFETIGGLVPIDSVNKAVTDMVALKKEGVSMADKIQKATKGDFKAILGDKDSLLEVGADKLAKYMKEHGSELGAELTAEVNAYVSQASNLITSFTSDKDLFDQIADVDLSKMAEQLKGTKLEGMMDSISIAKDIYNAGHGIVYDAQGVYKYFKNSFDFGGKGTDYSGREIYLKWKDKKVVGDRIKQLYMSGELEHMIKAGTMVKDNMGNLVNCAMGIYNSYNLYNADADSEVYSQDDEIAREVSYEEQNKAIKEEKFKISKEEQELSEKSMERNKSLGKLGTAYGHEKTQDNIIDLLTGAASSSLKVSVDVTGTISSLVKEAGEFVKFFNKCLTDESVINKYIINGLGRETYEKYREYAIQNGRSTKESSLVKGTLRMMGFKNGMEARTFVGRQIVQSLLFALTDANTLKGIKSRAEAILKMVGKDGLAGRMDEAAQVELYDALIGAM